MRRFVNGTPGPKGDRPMGPRPRRVARKVISPVPMATDTRAKASRQEYCLPTQIITMPPSSAPMLMPE